MADEDIKQLIDQAARDRSCELDLSHDRLGRDLNDADLLFLAKRAEALPQLRALNPGGRGQWQDITDAGVQAIAEKLTSLTSLNLHGCRKITDAGVQAIADKLTSLTSLNLAYCDNITDAGVQAISEKLTSLTSLNLAWCRNITDAGVQAIAEKLTSLTSLNLAGCEKITDAGVQAIAEKLTSLTSLNLALCEKITDAGVQAIADKLTSLTSLDLSDCRNMTDANVQAIAEKLTGLTSLDLGECKHITDAGVRAIAEKLASLTSLGLWECEKITDAGVQTIAEELTSLTSLHLVGCAQITHAGVRDFGRLTQLGGLGLLRNRISRLPGDIGFLRNLRSLDLRHSRLEELPESLLDLAERGSLEYLNLFGNDALGIPAEVLGGSIDPGKPLDVLRYYFAARREGTSLLNEAKLLVVGQPEVGKTRLVGWLVDGRDPGDKGWTRGVKIAQWFVDSAEAGGDPIRVNVWDFGGQEIMQSTHQFFMTEGSLYLLVLDARNNEEQSLVRHWLEKIQTFGGGSPVILVINKQDVGSLAPNETRMKNDYGAILYDPFHKTACVGGAGIDELRTAIVRRIRELDHVRKAVPKSYLAAKRALEAEARQKKNLTREQYAEVCSKHGVREPEDQDALLPILKNLGTLYYYQEQGHPDDAQGTFVLDPEWVTDGVYGVLTCPKLKKDGGELDAARLDDYFDFDKEGDYPQEKQRFILGMMTVDQFELCFQIPDQPGRYLVPEQLPSDEIGHGIEPEGSLNFEYHYKYLPGGLIPRFVVRTHASMEQTRGSAWRDGVILKLDGCRALVRGSREEGRVFISVTGNGDRSRALFFIRQTLHEIHAAMKHLRVDPRVPLPDNPSVSVSYDHLLVLTRDPEAGPLHRLKPEGARRWYGVDELLEGIEPVGLRRALGMRIRGADREASPWKLEYGEEPPGPSRVPREAPPAPLRDVPARGPESKRWWHGLIAPGVSSVAVAILVLLLYLDKGSPVTLVYAAGITAFAVVYCIRKRWQWRSDHWPKYLAFVCVGMAGAVSLVPGWEGEAESPGWGWLRFASSNSSWAVGVFIAGAVAFGYLQLKRERSA